MMANCPMTFLCLNTASRAGIVDFFCYKSFLVKRYVGQ
jgi:hypothetical protein